MSNVISEGVGAWHNEYDELTAFPETIRSNRIVGLVAEVEYDQDRSYDAYMPAQNGAKAKLIIGGKDRKFIDAATDEHVAELTAADSPAFCDAVEVVAQRCTDPASYATPSSAYQAETDFNRVIEAAKQRIQAGSLERVEADVVAGMYEAHIWMSVNPNKPA